MCSPWFRYASSGDRVVSYGAGVALAIAVAGALTGGCSTRGLVTQAGSDFALRATRSYRDEPDLELARISGYANLKLLETFHRDEPDDEALTLALAEGFAGAALAFAEEEALDARCGAGATSEDPAVVRIADLYARAGEYAVSSLESRHPDARASLSLPPRRLKDWLAGTRRNDARTLVWLAAAWLGEHGARTEGFDPSTIGRARAVAARVAELDPKLLDGLPLLLLGVIDATVSSRASVSPDRGRAYFARALEASEGRLLLVRVERARTLHVAVGDREAYREDLEAVLRAPVEILPGERLLTVVAQRRARRLLARERTLFDGRIGRVHAYHRLPCVSGRQRPRAGDSASGQEQP